VGHLNEKEVNYLVQYAINSLMAMGMEFDLKSNPDEVDKIRMKVAEGTTLN
jgi:hypothetical protein